MATLFKNPYAKEFYVVVQPYQNLGYKKRRWLVSLNNLYRYIGSHNANTALTKALSMRTDKHRFKFRTFGIVDFYVK
jgi:hypothetical protein